MSMESGEHLDVETQGGNQVRGAAGWLDTQGVNRIRGEAGRLDAQGVNRERSAIGGKTPEMPIGPVDQLGG